MTTLAKDTPRTLVTGDMNSIPIIEDDIVYEGAMVGLVAASGYGRPLVAGDIFMGHAVVKVDNTGGANGDKNIRLRSGRYRMVCTLTGVAITDVGAPVYASDDDTLTLTSTSNSFVGRVSRYIKANTAEIEFDTMKPVATT